MKTQWLRQFTITFGTDDGDDTTTFNGTIPQTLMMMNGDMIRRATSTEAGGFLDKMAKDPKMNDAAKINHLFMATLARKPEHSEIDWANKLLGRAKGRSDQRPARRVLGGAEHQRVYFESLSGKNRSSKIEVREKFRVRSSKVNTASQKRSIGEQTPERVPMSYFRIPSDMTRRHFMSHLAGAAAMASPAIAFTNSLLASAVDMKKKHKACILLWMSGGPSTIDIWDLKPGAPTGGQFKPISTSLDGLQISEHHAASWPSR